MSILLLSFRRAAGGILCAPCRRVTNISCSILTLLAGWWGIPWGLIWTPQALFINLRGGHRSAAADALMLSALSQQMAATGQGLAGAEAYNAAVAMHGDAARAAAAQPIEAADAIGGVATARTSKRADILRFAGAGVVLFLIVSAFGGALGTPVAAGDTQLVFEGPAASYTGSSVRVTGNVRNTSQRAATGVWVEVVVFDAATGREVGRAKKPSSAPTSDVTVPAQGSVPFEVSVTLAGSQPENVRVSRTVHWRR